MFVFFKRKKQQAEKRQELAPKTLPEEHSAEAVGQEESFDIDLGNEVRAPNTTDIEPHLVVAINAPSEESVADVLVSEPEPSVPNVDQLAVDNLSLEETITVEDENTTMARETVDIELDLNANAVTEVVLPVDGPKVDDDALLNVEVEAEPLETVQAEAAVEEVDEFEIGAELLDDAQPEQAVIAALVDQSMGECDAAKIEAAVKAMQQAAGGDEIFDFTHDNEPEPEPQCVKGGFDFYDDERELPETLILQEDAETVDAETIEAQMLAIQAEAGEWFFGNKRYVQPNDSEAAETSVGEAEQEPVSVDILAPVVSSEPDALVSAQEATSHVASMVANDAPDVPTKTKDNTHTTMVSELLMAEPEKISWAARLKQGLTKSRDHMAKSLVSVFGGGQIDEDLYEELETVLLTSDMGIEATERLMEEVRARVSLRGLADGKELRQALKDALYALLRPLEQPLIVPENTSDQPFVIMMAGINGAGKTTSIGKLAKYFQLQGKSVVLAAGDTFRAAAREQLQEWGKRNDVMVISQASGDSAAVCFDAVEAAKARKIDIVLADTAGRLPTQLHLMEEIKKVKRVLQKSIPDAPHEIMVVLDANIGQNALNQVKAFNDVLGVTGLIVTKLDGTAKGGVLAALASHHDIPVRYIGVGEKIDDLRPFDTRAFVEALLGDG